MYSDVTKKENYGREKWSNDPQDIKFPYPTHSIQSSSQNVERNRSDSRIKDPTNGIKFSPNEDKDYHLNKQTIKITSSRVSGTKCKPMEIIPNGDINTRRLSNQKSHLGYHCNQICKDKSTVNNQIPSSAVPTISRIPRPLSMPPNIRRSSDRNYKPDHYIRDLKNIPNRIQGEMMPSMGKSLDLNSKCKPSSDYTQLSSKLPPPPRSPVMHENQTKMIKPNTKVSDSLVENPSPSTWPANSSEGTSIHSSNQAFVTKLLGEKSPDTTLVESPGNLRTVSKDNSETQPDHSITFTDSRIKSEYSVDGVQTKLTKCPNCAFPGTEHKARQYKPNTVDRNRKKWKMRCTDRFRGTIVQQLLRCVKDSKTNCSMDSVNNKSKLSTFLNIHDADKDCADDDDRTLKKSAMVSVFDSLKDKKPEPLNPSKNPFDSIRRKSDCCKQRSPLDFVPKSYIKRSNIPKRVHKKQHKFFRRLDQRLVQLGQLQSNSVTTAENNFLSLHKCLDNLNKQIEKLTQSLNDQSIVLTNLSKVFECRERIVYDTTSPGFDQDPKKNSPLHKFDVLCAQSRIQTPDGNVEYNPRSRASMYSRSVSVASRATRDSGLSRRSSVALTNKQTASSEDYTVVTEPCSKLSDKTDKFSYAQTNKPVLNLCYNVSPKTPGKLFTSNVLVPNENGDTESVALVEDIPVTGKTPDKEASIKSTSSLPLNVNELKYMTQEMKHQTLQKYYRIAYIGQDPDASVEALNKSQLSVNPLKFTSRVDSVVDKENSKVRSPMNKSLDVELTRVPKEAKLVACEFVPCKVKSHQNKKHHETRSNSQPKMTVKNQIRNSIGHSSRVLSASTHKEVVSNRIIDNVDSCKTGYPINTWVAPNSKISSPNYCNSIIQPLDQNKSAKGRRNGHNELLTTKSNQVNCAGDTNNESMIHSLNSSYTVVCHSKMVTTVPSKPKSHIVQVRNGPTQLSNKTTVQYDSKKVHRNTETSEKQKNSHSFNNEISRNKTCNYSSRICSTNSRCRTYKSKQSNLPMDGVWKAHLHLAVNKYCPGNKKINSNSSPHTGHSLYIAGCNNSSLDLTLNSDNQLTIKEHPADPKYTSLDCVPFSELSKKQDPILGFYTMNKRKFQQMKQAFYHKSNEFALPEDLDQPELSFSQKLIARGRAVRRAAQEKQIYDEMEKLCKQRLDMKSPHTEVVPSIDSTTNLPKITTTEVPVTTSQENMCNGQSESKQKEEECEFVCDCVDPCISYKQQRKYVIDCKTDQDLEKVISVTRQMMQQQNGLCAPQCCSTSSPIVCSSGSPVVCCSQKSDNRRKNSDKKCFTIRLSETNGTPSRICTVNSTCGGPCISTCYPPCSSPRRSISCENPCTTRWIYPAPPAANPIINTVCSCPMCFRGPNPCYPDSCYPKCNPPCNMPCCTRISRCYSRCRSRTSSESIGTVSRVCNSDGYCDLIYLTSSSASTSQTPVKLKIKKDRQGRKNKKKNNDTYQCCCGHNSCSNSFRTIDRGYHSSTSLSDESCSRNSSSTSTTTSYDSQYECWENNKLTYRGANSGFAIQHERFQLLNRRGFIPFPTAHCG